MSQKAYYPFFVFGSILLYGITLPGCYKDVGFVFFYPIYGHAVIMSLFTTGSWMVIYLADYIMRKEVDHVYNEKFFKFYTVGSLFVYLCHDLWITVIATYILLPNMKENNPRVEGISFQLALFTMIFGVEVLSNLTYYLFLKMYLLCCSKKKHKNSSAKGKGQK